MNLRDGRMEQRCEPGWRGAHREGSGHCRPSAVVGDQTRDEVAIAVEGADQPVEVPAGIIRAGKSLESARHRLAPARQGGDEFLVQDLFGLPTCQRGAHDGAAEQDHGDGKDDPGVKGHQTPLLAPSELNAHSRGEIGKNSRAQRELSPWAMAPAPTTPRRALIGETMLSQRGWARRNALALVGWVLAATIPGAASGADPAPADNAVPPAKPPGTTPSRGNLPGNARAAGGTQVSEVVITARRLDEARATIQPQVGASTYTIGKEAIQIMPGGENAPLNQVVLQAPGVAEDSYGQIHVRGEHNGLQYPDQRGHPARGPQRFQPGARPEGHRQASS